MPESDTTGGVQTATQRARHGRGHLAWAERLSRGQVLRAIASAALVAAIFLGVLPRIADLSEVWATIRAMSWLEVLTLSAVSLWNLASYWVVLMAVLPGLSFPRAAAVNLAGGAVSNSVPGGGAVAVGLTYSMLASWGFPNAAIALSVLVSGVWNTFVKLGLPVLALALLLLQRRASAPLAVAAAAGLGLLVASVATYALMLRSAVLAHRVGGWLGRVVSRLRGWVRKEPVHGWAEASVRFRAQTIDLLRARWGVITAASVLSHLALYLVLLLTLRHVGVSEAEVGWIAVLGAFAFVRLLSALPITPGGLGVVELGLTGALVLAGGARAQVVAAVLVYRVLTFLPTIPLGVLAYVWWRRSGRGRASLTLPDGPASPPLATVDGGGS